jgi:hypothetical protein
VRWFVVYGLVVGEKSGFLIYLRWSGEHGAWAMMPGPC